MKHRLINLFTWLYSAEQNFNLEKLLPFNVQESKKEYIPITSEELIESTQFVQSRKKVFVREKQLNALKPITIETTKQRKNISIVETDDEIHFVERTNIDSTDEIELIEKFKTVQISERINEPHVPEKIDPIKKFKKISIGEEYNKLYLLLEEIKADSIQNDLPPENDLPIEEDEIIKHFETHQSLSEFISFFKEVVNKSKNNHYLAVLDYLISTHSSLSYTRPTYSTEMLQQYQNVFKNRFVELFTYLIDTDMGNEVVAFYYRPDVHKWIQSCLPKNDVPELARLVTKFYTNKLESLPKPPTPSDEARYTSTHLSILKDTFESVEFTAAYLLWLIKSAQSPQPQNLELVTKNLKTPTIPLDKKIMLLDSISELFYFESSHAQWLTNSKAEKSEVLQQLYTLLITDGQNGAELVGAIKTYASKMNGDVLNETRYTDKTQQELLIQNRIENHPPENTAIYNNYYAAIGSHYLCNLIRVYQKTKSVSIEAYLKTTLNHEPHGLTKDSLTPKELNLNSKAEQLFYSGVDQFLYTLARSRFAKDGYQSLISSLLTEETRRKLIISGHFAIFNFIDTTHLHIFRFIDSTGLKKTNNIERYLNRINGKHAQMSDHIPLLKKLIDHYINFSERLSALKKTNETTIILAEQEQIIFRLFQKIIDILLENPDIKDKGLFKTIRKLMLRVRATAEETLISTDQSSNICTLQVQPAIPPINIFKKHCQEKEKALVDQLNLVIQSAYHNNPTNGLKRIKACWSSLLPQAQSLTQTVGPENTGAFPRDKFALCATIVTCWLDYNKELTNDINISEFDLLKKLIPGQNPRPTKHLTKFERGLFGILGEILPENASRTPKYFTDYERALLEILCAIKDKTLRAQVIALMEGPLFSCKTWRSLYYRADETDIFSESPVQIHFPTKTVISLASQYNNSALMEVLFYDPREPVATEQAIDLLIQFIKRREIKQLFAVIDLLDKADDVYKAAVMDSVFWYAVQTNDYSMIATLLNSQKTHAYTLDLTPMHLTRKIIQLHHFGFIPLVHDIVQQFISSNPRPEFAPSTGLSLSVSTTEDGKTASRPLAHELSSITELSKEALLKTVPAVLNAVTLLGIEDLAKKLIYLMPNNTEKIMHAGEIAAEHAHLNILHFIRLFMTNNSKFSLENRQAWAERILSIAIKFKRLPILRAMLSRDGLLQFNLQKGAIEKVILKEKMDADIARLLFYYQGDDNLDQGIQQKVLVRAVQDKVLLKEILTELAHHHQTFNPDILRTLLRSLLPSTKDKTTQAELRGIRWDLLKMVLECKGQATLEKTLMESLLKVLLQTLTRPWLSTQPWQVLFILINDPNKEWLFYTDTAPLVSELFQVIAKKQSPQRLFFALDSVNRYKIDEGIFDTKQLMNELFYHVVSAAPSLNISLITELINYKYNQNESYFIPMMVAGLDAAHQHVKVRKEVTALILSTKHPEWTNKELHERLILDAGTRGLPDVCRTIINSYKEEATREELAMLMAKSAYDHQQITVLQYIEKNMGHTINREVLHQLLDTVAREKNLDKVNELINFDPTPEYKSAAFTRAIDRFRETGQISLIMKLIKTHQPVAINSKDSDTINDEAAETIITSLNHLNETTKLNNGEIFNILTAALNSRRWDIIQTLIQCKHRVALDNTWICRLLTDANSKQQWSTIITMCSTNRMEERSTIKRALVNDRNIWALVRTAAFKAESLNDLKTMYEYSPCNELANWIVEFVIKNKDLSIIPCVLAPLNYVNLCGSEQQASIINGLLKTKKFKTVKDILKVTTFAPKTQQLIITEAIKSKRFSGLCEIFILNTPDCHKEWLDILIQNAIGHGLSEKESLCKLKEKLNPAALTKEEPAAPIQSSHQQFQEDDDVSLIAQFESLWVDPQPSSLDIQLVNAIEQHDKTAITEILFERHYLSSTNVEQRVKIISDLMLIDCGEIVKQILENVWFQQPTEIQTILRYILNQEEQQFLRLCMIIVSTNTSCQKIWSEPLIEEAKTFFYLTPDVINILCTSPIMQKILNGEPIEPDIISVPLAPVFSLSTSIHSTGSNHVSTSRKQDTERARSRAQATSRRHVVPVKPSSFGDRKPPDDTSISEQPAGFFSNKQVWPIGVSSQNRHIAPARKESTVSSLSVGFNLFPFQRPMVSSLPQDMASISSSQSQAPGFSFHQPVPRQVILPQTVEGADSDDSISEEDEGPSLSQKKH